MNNNVSKIVYVQCDSGGKTRRFAFEHKSSVLYSHLGYTVIGSKRIFLSNILTRKSKTIVQKCNHVVAKIGLVAYHRRMQSSNGH